MTDDLDNVTDDLDIFLIKVEIVLLFIKKSGGQKCADVMVDILYIDYIQAEMARIRYTSRSCAMSRYRCKPHCFHLYKL